MALVQEAVAVSIMQHARSSYAGLLGSVGRCGNTATAEVTEGAVTFWKIVNRELGSCFAFPKSGNRTKA